jgi:hypothetical protein
MFSFYTIILFLTVAGFVVGLGAVTVIDSLGFLARKSPYFTLATIRAHKVTKPLIWLGTALMVLAGSTFYYLSGEIFNLKIHFFVSLILIANGTYLSLVVSKYLIKQEKNNKDTELLPTSLQYKIMASFLVSFTGWWGLLLLLVTSLLE